MIGARRKRKLDVERVANARRRQWWRTAIAARSSAPSALRRGASQAIGSRPCCLRGDSAAADLQNFGLRPAFQRQPPRRADAQGDRALVVGCGGCGPYGRARPRRQPPITTKFGRSQEGYVERTGMGRAIGADKAGSVDGEPAPAVLDRTSWTILIIARLKKVE